jgi:hypothetical protein
MIGLHLLLQWMLRERDLVVEPRIGQLIGCGLGWEPFFLEAVRIHLTLLSQRKSLLHTTCHEC